MARRRADDDDRRAGRCRAASRFETAEGRAVARVINARTLALDDGETARLAGIETFTALLDEPERPDHALVEALAPMIAASRLAVHRLPGARDRHGRVPIILLADGVPVQERLVRDGLALVLPQADAPPDCVALWLAAEDKARHRGAGFWGEAEALVHPADPAAFAGRAGRFAIVEGRIRSISTRRNRSYLNFGTKWSQDVTGEIDADDRARFGGAAGIEALAGRRVRVRGFVEERGGPAIRLSLPGQIETLDRMREK